MPYKYFPIALVVSLSLHAAAVYSFHALPGSARLSKPAEDNLIFISEVKYAPPEPAKKPEVKIQKKSGIKPAPVAPPKKILSAPAPVKAEPARAVSRAVARAAVPASPKPIRRAAVVDASELSLDPKKGKFFTDYFSHVKQKIRQTLQRKSRETRNQGKVALLFILDSDGRLEEVSVLDRQSDADDSTKNLAKTSLAEAAPFPHFPKELPMGRLSFHLTVCFEER